MIGKAWAWLIRSVEVVKIWTHAGNIRLPAMSVDPQAVGELALLSAFSLIYRTWDAKKNSIGNSMPEFKWN